MMELSPLPLDRLPLKRDVVVHYIFMKRDPSTCHLKETIAITASILEFIWNEAGIPLAADVVDAVSGLLKDFVRALTGNDENTNAKHFYDVYSESLATDPGAVSAAINSDDMNELFDVSLDSEGPIVSDFYHDQKTTRKRRIESRKGQRALQGDDVYYTFMYGKVRQCIGQHTGHYILPQDTLPTILDMLKYFHTRLGFRKYYNSAGPMPIHTRGGAIFEAGDAQLSIWKRKINPSLVGTARMSRGRLENLIDEHTTLIGKGNGLVSLHQEGLGLLYKSSRCRFDNDSYFRVFHEETYDQEVFPMFTTISGFKYSLYAKPAKSFSESDVQVGNIGGGLALDVADFERLVNDSKFNSDAWLRGESLVEEDEMEQFAANCNDDEDSPIVEEGDYDGGNKEASTQTVCSQSCFTKCSHF